MKVLFEQKSSFSGYLILPLLLVGKKLSLCSAWIRYCVFKLFNLWFYHLPSGGIPPSRWVVNFDYDLLDGLVLAAVLAAHVPFLVSSTSSK